MGIEQQKDTEEIMEALGNGIDEFFKENIGAHGYALLVFPFGDPGVGNYVSNVKREDMIDALREAANRLEKNQYMPPCIGGIN
jgi:hypothetical protein